MRILIIENGYRDLVNARFPLGDFFKNQGHLVRYACPKPPIKSDIFDLTISRSKPSPFLLIVALKKLLKIETDEKIDCILSFRLTSNILNYLSSFFGQKKRRVAVITGLGYAFVYDKIKYKILRNLICFFYQMAEKRLTIVAQNKDDLNDLNLKKGKVILGSGILQNNLSNNINFDKINTKKLLFVGRLLKSKGIKKAINVFKNIKKSNPNIELIIAGDIDMHNPDSISNEELFELKEIEGVKYLDYVTEMSKIYSNCDILLFPSVYREGVPRVIIEALSYGLTIVTYDKPGCKETVSNNGLLVKNNFENNACDYINTITINDLINNNKESLKIFNDKFSSKMIFPQYLKALMSE